MNWLHALFTLATVVIVLGVLYRPFGDYMAWAYTTRKDFKVERGIYRVIGVDPHAEQTWQAYLRGVLTFSAVGLLIVYSVQRLQQWPYGFHHGCVLLVLLFLSVRNIVGKILTFLDVGLTFADK